MEDNKKNYFVKTEENGPIPIIVTTRAGSLGEAFSNCLEKGIKLVNASMVDEDYAMASEYIVLDIDKDPAEEYTPG